MLRNTSVLALSFFFSLSAFAQPNAPAEVIVKDPVGERLHRYLQWAEAYGFEGSVLIALNGEIKLHNAYGLADRDSRRRNTISTVFSFGSIAKQFTGAGIMKLVQEGKLNVHDPINKYIEKVPPDKTEITIHQLLNHTSGILNSISSDDFLEVTRDEAVRQILDSELVASPGTEFNYSNSGVSLAAAIIEIVSGQEYRAFLRKHLFEPAGMTSVGFMGENRWSAEDVARIYAGSKDNGSPREFPGPFWVLLGNGGVVTTVGEMYLWHQALQDDAILTAESKQAIFTPDPAKFAYGYGWDIVKTIRNTTRHGHDGASTLGLSAQFYRFPEEDGVMVFASNSMMGNQPAIRVITQPLYRTIFEDWVSLKAPPEVHALEERDQRARTGTYHFESKGTLTVRRERGELMGYLTGHDLLEKAGIVRSEDQEEYRALNRKAVTVMNAVYAGDRGPLAAALGDVERAASWEKTFRSWSETRGAYKEIQILGTRRLWEESKDEAVTWLRAVFDRRSRLFRIHWVGDSFGDLGGQALRAPASGPIRFINESDAVLFDFDSARPVALSFKLSREGKAKAVSLRTSHEPIVGTREY